MLPLRISTAASRDIEEIYLYGFIHFGEAQADRYASLMKDRFQLICSNPEIGRLDIRVNPAIRRFEFESHVIFYDLAEDHILVGRVLHRSTDFLQHLP